MSKRILSIIFVLVFLFSLSSWSVFAESSEGDSASSDEENESEVYRLEGTETSDAVLRRIQPVNSNIDASKDVLTTYEVWFSAEDQSYFSANKIEYRCFDGAGWGFFSILFDESIGISVSQSYVNHNLERVEMLVMNSVAFDDDVLRAGLKHIQVQLSSPSANSSDGKYIELVNIDFYVTYVIETAEGGVEEKTFTTGKSFTYDVNASYIGAFEDIMFPELMGRLYEKMRYATQIEFFEELVVSEGVVYAQFVHKGALVLPEKDTNNTNTGGGVSVGGSSDDDWFEFEFLRDKPALKRALTAISMLCLLYEIYWVISKIKESRKKKRTNK